MTTLTTRTTSSGIGVAAKGSPLTNSELDLNFISLNDSKVEKSTSNVAIGTNAGINQGTSAIAIGISAGQTNQGERAVALGVSAGNNNQSSNAVAIGSFAGNSGQKAAAIAIGIGAGQSVQQAAAIAIGDSAGQSSQGGTAIALGNSAGRTNQSSNAIAIGNSAGNTNQGSNAVALGFNAGYNIQCSNSIVINASGSILDTTTASALYVNPIRSADLATYNLLAYNTSNSEVVKLPTVKLVPGSTSLINHLVVNFNTASLAEAAPHLATSTGIIIQGADSSNSVLQLDTYGTGFAPYVMGRRSMGARGSEAPPINGRNLLIVDGTGWVTSTFTGAKARLTFTAAEDWNATSNGTHILFLTTQTGTTTLSEKMRITDAGNVGIGTGNPNPWGKLAVVGSSAAQIVAAIVNTSGTASSQAVLSFDTTNNGFNVRDSQIRATNNGGNQTTLEFYTSNAATPTEKMRIDNLGNVSIGTSTTATYKLQVAGSFAATTKSFLIPHPTKPDLQLQHGSLEGPENGVYVRGSLTDGNSIIQLPDYWTGLVDAQTITVNLTPFGEYQQLYVEKIENNRVYVSGDKYNIRCFYTVWAERKDVEKLKVEI